MAGEDGGVDIKTRKDWLSNEEFECVGRPEEIENHGASYVQGFA